MYFYFTNMEKIDVPEDKVEIRFTKGKSKRPYFYCVIEKDGKIMKSSRFIKKSDIHKYVKEDNDS